MVDIMFFTCAQCLCNISYFNFDDILKFIGKDSVSIDPLFTRDPEHTACLKNRLDILLSVNVINDKSTRRMANFSILKRKRFNCRNYLRYVVCYFKDLFR